jgi:hypothetical protein
MATPSKVVNVDHGGYTLISQAANKRIASKHFTLDSVTSDVELTAGVSGMRRKKLIVRCESDDDLVVYLGPDGVTTATGWPMYAGDEVEFDVNDQAEMHAVASASGSESATVYIIELE